MADDVRADSQADRAAPAGLVCPVCRVDLVMSERQGIEIDYCPQCRGVWLDRGELDKILERAEREIPLTGRRDDDFDRDDDRYRTERYRDDDDDRYKSYGGYGRPHKKRKSFLSDMFEFGD